MCRNSLLLICFVLAMVLSNTAEAVDPDLLLWWKFDEGSGTTATDSSGNNRHGALVGPPTWVAGQIGGALDFDGAGDYVIDADAGTYMNGLSALSVAMWIKADYVGGNDRGFIIFEAPTSGQDKKNIRFDSDGGGGDEDLFKYGVHTVGDAREEDESPSNLQTTDWMHVCVTWESGSGTFPAGLNFYLDGVLYTPEEDDGDATTTTELYDRVMVGQGCKDDGTDGWDGLIDDVQIYSRRLTVEEIETIMEGAVYVATAPNPADGAEDVSIETNLTWTRGDGAKWDQVYFGTDPCDANLTLAATIPDFQAAEYDPGDPNLLPSTTYYWYITEINAPNEYPGPVWSFTTIPGEAQCQYPGDGTVIPGDPYPPTPSILYTELVFTPGPTAVKHTGYLSKVRDDVVNRAQDANLNSPPLGHYSGYEYKYFAGHPAFYPYEGLIRGQVYYWTVDETDSSGNVFPGDVWEFAVQDFYAFVPSPPNEAIFIDTDVLLSWLEGYSAQNHDVFIGTSWEDVNNAYFDFSTPSDEYVITTSTGINYHQLSDLDPETTYYWRIDEVQGRFPPAIGLIYKGPVWEFTTTSATPGLTGEYYHHSGGASPAGFESKMLIRIDPNINFGWDTGSPGPGVNPDDFSVRWTGQIAVPTKGETYTFTTETDDGVRLWVNGQLIVDQWIDQGTTAHSGTIELDDFGPYDIKMEYYENGGGAAARLYWESLSTAYGIVPENFLAPNLGAFTTYGPYPRNGSLLTNWTPILSWGPAMFAATHNLYFSTDFDDVNERSVSPISLTDPCYHSPRLDLDQTYYWAVDGVNSPGLWEGDVWSFTIPHGGIGSILREWWLGIGGDAVSALTGDARYPDSPTGQELIPDFDGPVNWANDYGSRIHGWLRPPTTGDYKFWIASDNHSELWLSSDAESGNVGPDPIAQQTGSPWDRYNWDADPERESNSISLQAGKKYYISGLLKEGGGGDNFAVAWQGPPTSPVPAREVIDGSYLSPTPHDPPEAYGPYPADGATNVEDRSPVLSWYPGFHTQAVNGHRLYFSPSFADKGTLTEPNYPYPPPPLLLDRTYYWAVDEVNSFGPAPYQWKGRVWSFTTATCIALDNMEDYNDRGEIRGVWTDGYASVGWGGVYPFKYPLNTASSGSNLNVSTEVGSPSGGAGPIHGGTQAMVLLYENDGNTYTRLPGEEEWVYDS
ncbi:MAG: PA14 domain-containing protein, partial [Planctomycetota bacterium]